MYRPRGVDLIDKLKEEFDAMAQDLAMYKRTCEDYERQRTPRYD